LKKRSLLLGLLAGSVWAGGAIFASNPSSNSTHGYYLPDGNWVELKPAYAEGSLLQDGDYLEFWLISGGMRRCIPDPVTFQVMGFDRSQIIHVTEDELAKVPEGPPFVSLGFGEGK
jgi:hypothetical protein